jgi:hypothetical protein
MYRPHCLQAMSFSNVTKRLFRALDGLRPTSPWQAAEPKRLTLPVGICLDLDSLGNEPIYRPQSCLNGSPHGTRDNEPSVLGKWVGHQAFPKRLELLEAELGEIWIMDMVFPCITLLANAREELAQHPHHQYCATPEHGE